MADTGVLAVIGGLEAWKLDDLVVVFVGFLMRRAKGLMENL